MRNRVFEFLLFLALGVSLLMTYVAEAWPEDVEEEPYATWIELGDNSKLENFRSDQPTVLIIRGTNTFLKNAYMRLIEQKIFVSVER